MIFENLQKNKIKAIKEKDKFTEKVLSNMISEIQKATIPASSKLARRPITDDLCLETISKYRKMVQEMIDTCPPERHELLSNYNAEMKIVEEYAPTMIDDENEIRKMILDIAAENNLSLTAQDKKRLMPVVMKTLKTNKYIDLKIANKIMSEIK